jgi:hypothetical protein
MKTYAISQFKQSDFTSKMDKFSKRAAKLGIEFGYTLESKTIGTYSVKDSFGETVKHYYEIFNYSVYGESPVINGYSFLAKIEPFEGVNLIHSHNNDYDFSSYENANLTCEHCRVNRMRNFYYLVLNESTGEVKMLGGNCLAQYIAQPNAEEIASFYADCLGLDDSMAEDMEENFKNHSRDFLVNISEFLAYGINSVNNHGYTSSKNSDMYKLSTKDSTIQDYFSVGIERIIISEDLVNQASNMIQVITTALTAKLESNNDNLLTNYENTLLNILTIGKMKITHAGYVVSIIPLYNRMMEEKVTKETTKQSEYIGTVGDKIANVSATVIKTSQFESGYGLTYIFTFQSDSNILVWFSSNNVCDLGDNVIITKGTIKDHKEYNGTKQTIITRCKLETIK